MLVQFGLLFSLSSLGSIMHVTTHYSLGSLVSLVLTVSLGTFGLLDSFTNSRVSLVHQFHR